MTQYVFIAGAGHSGSTLLDLVLGGHSQIVSVGELKQLEYYVKENKNCTCEKKVTNCNFWTDVRDNVLESTTIDIFKNPEQFRLPLDSRKMSFSQKLKHGLLLISKTYQSFNFINRYFKSENAVVANIFALYDAIRKISGKPIIVDSSKSPLLMKILWANNPSAFKIIYLVRDGRAVFASNLRKKKNGRSAVTGWVKTNRLFSQLSKDLPANSFLEVSYEVFCSNPNEELKRICNFLGVSFECGMLVFDKVRHNIDGNRMRFSTSKISFDEKWRKELSPAQLSLFNRLGKKMNTKLGYK